MHIIGTAGHVDHGKSSLVIALTGHNPDRLLEEQQRGMTLDLGFAPLRFSDGVEAGIVDVPGHERFLHNMLAGAAGMELLLLVIAATEGPKPQTYEHLHILNFLNVSRVIIVLTKIDLVDRDAREIAAQLARDAVRGTVAQDAPMFEVSTVSGEGVDALKTAIHDALAALPPRRPDSPPYLPVDRVFALPGHGTIVTGTLMQGVISIGDTLALQPSGLRARVRNLQVFGKRVERAAGGARLAINLPGIGVDQIARGESLVSTREFTPAHELLVDFTALSSTRALLRRRMPVRVHLGSGEILGQMRFVDGPPHDERAVPARLLLWKPAVFYPGLRIIVRRMSPKDLLGGAIVRSAVRPESAIGDGARRMLADAADAPAPSTSDVPAGFDEAPAGALEVDQALTASGLRPLSAAQLAARANVAQPAAEAALAWLVEHGRAVIVHKPVEYVGRAAFDAGFARLQTALRERHEQTPWRLGLSAGEVARALEVEEPLAARLLHALHEDGRIAVRSGFWHLPEFSFALTGVQKAFFARAVAPSNETPYLPHSYAAISHAAQKSSDLAEALESLLAAGAFARIGDDLYRRSQVESAQAAIAAYLSKHGSATMAQLRDVLGTSRKYALPLMEYFDSIGFTIRDGDLRRLRKAK